MLPRLYQLLVWLCWLVAVSSQFCIAPKTLPTGEWVPAHCKSWQTVQSWPSVVSGNTNVEFCSSSYSLEQFHLNLCVSCSGTGNFWCSMSDWWNISKAGKHNLIKQHSSYCISCRGVWLFIGALVFFSKKSVPFCAHLPPFRHMFNRLSVLTLWRMHVITFSQFLQYAHLCTCYTLLHSLTQDRSCLLGLEK